MEEEQETLPQRFEELQMRNPWFFTPLAEAVSNRDIDNVYRLLQGGAQVKLSSLMSMPSLYHWVQNHTLVDLLLQHDTDQNATDKLLAVAAERGHRKTVEVLLKYKTDPNATDGEGNTPLILASSGGRAGRWGFRVEDVQEYVKTVRLLLIHGSSSSHKGFHGITALHEAAEYGQNIIVELLLEHNADPNVTDEEGNTPLMLAASRGHVGGREWLCIGQEYVETIRLLLKHGATADQKGSRGRTALHDAATYGYHTIVDGLLQHNADPNVTDEDGNTPLMFAAGTPYAFNKHSRLVKTVEVLLSHGAKLEQKNNEGRTSLHWAAEMGHHSTVEVLLQHNADPNVTDKERNSPLISAAKKGHVEIVRMLLSHGALPNWNGNRDTTALYWAAANGHHSIVELLLQHNADPNAADSDGKTPLIVAAKEGHAEIARLLLSHAANIEHKDLGGKTSLQWALEKGNYSTVELLLQHKADPNTTDMWKNISLIDAAKQGHVETVRVLLNQGVKLDQQSRHWGRALHAAVLGRHCPIVELLLEYKADPNVTDVNGNTPLILAASRGNVEIVQVLLSHGVKLQDGPGKAAFTCAVQAGHHSVVKLFLQHKADPNAVLSIILAAKAGYDERGDTVPFFRSIPGIIETVKVLLSHGAQIEQKDLSSKTSLHWATLTRHYELVDLLLMNGADPNIPDKDGSTPFMLAVNQMDDYIIEIFLKSGAISRMKDDDVTSLIRHRDKNGRSVLHAAAHLQNAAFLTKLLSIGANTNAEDNNRDTPLHLALRNDKKGWSLFGMKDIPQCAKILLDRGAEVKGHGAGGKSVLHEAAGKGDKDIIEFLLKYNVNINMTDDAGNTPLKLALENERQDCAMMMMQHGAKLHGSDKTVAGSGNMVSLIHIAIRH